MAWQHQESGTYVKGADNSTLSVPYLTAASGHIFLLVVQIRASGVTADTPSGWTKIVDYSSSRNCLFAKVSDGTETGNVSVTATGGAGVQMFACMARFSGGLGTLGSIVESTPDGLYSSGVADIPVDAQNVTADNCLIITAGRKSVGNCLPYTAPSGFTEIDSEEHNTGTQASVSWAYQIQTTAANIGSGLTFNTASADTSDAYSFTVALLPETTTKKLKLLAHSSAASDTGVSGVVFDGTGYTTSDYLGAFSGASFEASLESGSAVLKVPVADFGGSALTTSSTPVAFIWNSSDAGIGPADCTVIEE